MNNLIFLVFAWLHFSHYDTSWIDNSGLKKPQHYKQRILPTLQNSPKSPNLLVHKPFLKYIFKQWLNNNEKK